MSSQPKFPYSLPDHVKVAFEPILRRVICREDDFRRIEGGLVAFDTRLRVAERAAVPGTKTARSLFETAQRLFKLAKANPMDGFVPHAIAAIDYLVTESDDIPDFSEDKSFRDDQHVLDAVIVHFGIRDKI
jgi:hypothetical protein